MERSKMWKDFYRRWLALFESEIAVDTIEVDGEEYDILDENGDWQAGRLVEQVPIPGTEHRREKRGMRPGANWTVIDDLLHALPQILDRTREAGLDGVPVRDWHGHVQRIAGIRKWLSPDSAPLKEVIEDFSDAIAAGWRANCVIEECFARLEAQEEGRKEERSAGSKKQEAAVVDEALSDKEVAILMVLNRFDGSVKFCEWRDALPNTFPVTDDKTIRGYRGKLERRGFVRKGEKSGYHEITEAGRTWLRQNRPKRGE